MGAQYEEGYIPPLPQPALSSGFLQSGDGGAPPVHLSAVNQQQLFTIAALVDDDEGNPVVSYSSGDRGDFLPTAGVGRNIFSDDNFMSARYRNSKFTTPVVDDAGSPSRALADVTGNIISITYNNKNNLPNVEQLGGYPLQYSALEIVLIIFVISAWITAVYRLLRGWSWNLRPPRDALRRKRFVRSIRRLKHSLSTSFSTRRAKSADQVRHHARTAADFIDEIEGPFTPRPRGLSKNENKTTGQGRGDSERKCRFAIDGDNQEKEILVVSEESETVLLEKPNFKRKEFAKKQIKKHSKGALSMDESVGIRPRLGTDIPNNKTTFIKRMSYSAQDIPSSLSTSTFD